MEQIEIYCHCHINNIYNQTLTIEPKQDNEEYITSEIIKSELYKKLIEKKEFLNKADLYGLEIEDIIIEYIRYFDDNIKGWLLLETDYLIIYNKEKIELLIEMSIKTTSQKHIMNQYRQMKKKLEKISESIKTNKTDKNNNQIRYSYSETDISVLIANPLVKGEFNEEINKIEIKEELKSMNDFHNIANSIYNVIRSSTKLINAEFYPLTENNLINVINNKPKIIHLICKSVYILPKNITEKDKSSDFVNLIFEDNNYCFMKFYNKDDLNYIFGINNSYDIHEDNEIEEIKKRKELIKDIVLIISTPLSEDVYNMVKDFGFKNVIVQHTTIANSDYVANFNEQFYKNIIEQNINNNNLNQDNEIIYKQKINDFFDNIDIKKEFFNLCCCCYHKHKNKCNLMKNLINELYQKNNINQIKDYFQEYFPHFSHLKYGCNGNKSVNKKKKKKICCCCKSHEDNINNIFFKDFTENENNNEIKLGCGLNSFGVIKNIEFLPSYENMKLIVGRNKLIYDIFSKLIYEKNEIINIYNNNIRQNYELNEIADILIGYLKERITFINTEEEKNIFKKSENFLLKRDKTFSDLNHWDFSDNIQLKIGDHLKSAPFVLESTKVFNFEKKTIRNNEFKIFNPKDKQKINFYFIIITSENLLIDNIIEKIIKDVLKGPNLSENKIIFLTFKEINHKFLEKYSFETFELNSIKDDDYKIKYQKEKPKKPEDEFEIFIIQEIKENMNINNIIINKESTIIYELLFLFKCLKLETINERELKTLYQGNIKSINEEIQKDFNEFNEMIQSNFKNFENNINNLNDTQKFNEYNKLINEIIDKLIHEFNLIKKMIANNKIYSLEKNEENNFNSIKELLTNSNTNIERTIKDNIKSIKETIIKKSSDIEKEELEKQYNISQENSEKNIKMIIMLFQEIYEKEFFTVKETIKNELKVILISTIKEEKQTTAIFKKINTHKNFDSYYKLWENKITEEVKQNIFIKFFKFYSILFPFLLNKEKINNERRNNNIFLNYYFTMKRLSEWLETDKSKIKNEEAYKEYAKYAKYILIRETVDEFLNNYFLELAYNFDKILNDENIDLCLSNPDISDEIKNYLDEISFTYFSCLKVFNINILELKQKIEIFEKYYKDNNPLLYTRLILMKWMYNYDIKDLDKVDFILNETKDYICEEEEIGKKFAKSIKKIKEDKIDMKINFEENEEHKQYDEKNFANIFECKVKYIVYKHRIKNGIYEDKDLEELKDDTENKCLATIFKENNYHLSEIKVYLCIAEWYQGKYKKDVNIEDKERFYEYLNFAFYVSSLYNIPTIKKFMKYLSEEKYNQKKNKKEEDNQAYENIMNKIEILCKKYNYEYKVLNLEYYKFEK